MVQLTFICKLLNYIKTVMYVKHIKYEVSMGRGEASSFPGNRWCQWCLRPGAQAHCLGSR